MEGESSTASSLLASTGAFSGERLSRSAYSLSSSMVNPYVPLASLKCTLRGSEQQARQAQHHYAQFRMHWAAVLPS